MFPDIHFRFAREEEPFAELTSVRQDGGCFPVRAR